MSVRTPLKTPLTADEEPETYYDEDDFREQFPPLGEAFRRSASKACSTTQLKRRLPILAWAPSYKMQMLFQDIVAGVTVGLTAIPQSIAYAVVAGLPPQYGLYSAFAGCFIYILFGSCKAVTIGPTAIMALMTEPYVSGYSPDFAVLLCFISGVIILLLGILNLGFLVRFISSSVISGFTTAAAITIASGQVKSLLGLPGHGTEFVPAWMNFFKNWRHTRLWDTVLGVSAIIILLLLKELGSHKERFKMSAKYISLSRNALIVFGGTLFAYILSIWDLEPFKLTGEIAKGFPPIGLPPFSTEWNNQTIGFIGMVKELGSAPIAIPLISILETVTIATIFCERGAAVDATQEMIAVGLCNIVGSFFSSMPTTGSFTRSAVNHSSGVKSPLGGAFTGALVLLALGLLTSTFYFIPKTILAAVIMAAMFPMMEFHEIVETWKTKRLDTIPLLATILSCLFIGLELGILIGVAVNLLILLISNSSPDVHVESHHIGDHELLVLTPSQSLNFSSADYFRGKVVKNVVQHPNTEYVVVNGMYIHTMDTTATKKLTSLIDNVRAQNKEVVLWNWKRSAYSLVVRYKRDYKDLFKFTSSIEELLYQLKINSSQTNGVQQVITTD